MTLKDSLKRFRKKSKPKWKRRPEILLSDNVPQPMHGTAPRVILGQAWWDATRKKAYASCSYCCIACGVHKSQAKSKHWLEGHELYKIDYPNGKMIYIEAVPLCHFCHNYIHDGRLKHLLEKGKIYQQKYVAILKHGDTVLTAAGLKRQSREEREAIFVQRVLTNTTAPWKDWRLVIDGLEYPPKFKTPQQWQKAME